MDVFDTFNNMDNFLQWEAQQNQKPTGNYS